MRTSGRRVAVALGAGGARGYAHIGAIQVLQERGYEVVALAGTSMGALVAGVMAAGKLEAYTEWSLSLTQREVLRLLDPTLTGGGAIRGERVIGKVGEILDGARIEDLAIPYTAVATDLGARREVWFQRGPVITAIRASVSIPGVITPVVVEGRLLVDGGLMNPVPIEPTAAITSDWTLAVSLSGPRGVGMGGGGQEEQQGVSHGRIMPRGRGTRGALRAKRCGGRIDKRYRRHSPGR
ncbi:MAG TPA: patatin-like phospholipase family protein, partial [Phycicoccus sp.]|nr:patatin-like phospholipase family protein [Phycicoccus sp.]